VLRQTLTGTGVRQGQQTDLVSLRAQSHRHRVGDQAGASTPAPASAVRTGARLRSDRPDERPAARRAATNSRARSRLRSPAPMPRASIHRLRFAISRSTFAVVSGE
jgi:hypothetical protein